MDENTNGTHVDGYGEVATDDAIWNARTMVGDLVFTGYVRCSWRDWHANASR